MKLNNLTIYIVDNKDIERKDKMAKTQKFLITLNDELIEAAKVKAAELGLSTSAYIRLLLAANIPKKGGGVLGK